MLASSRCRCEAARFSRCFNRYPVEQVNRGTVGLQNLTLDRAQSLAPARLVRAVQLPTGRAFACKTNTCPDPFTERDRA